jgi:hypothetical protein
VGAAEFAIGENITRFKLSIWQQMRSFQRLLKIQPIGITNFR